MRPSLRKHCLCFLAASNTSERAIPSSHESLSECQRFLITVNGFTHLPAVGQSFSNPPKPRKTHVICCIEYNLEVFSCPTSSSSHSESPTQGLSLRHEKRDHREQFAYTPWSYRKSWPRSYVPPRTLKYGWRYVALYVNQG